MLINSARKVATSNAEGKWRERETLCQRDRDVLVVAQPVFREVLMCR